MQCYLWCLTPMGGHSPLLGATKDFHKWCRGRGGHLSQMGKFIGLRWCFGIRVLRPFF